MTNKKQKNIFHAKIIHSINLPQFTHLNTDDFLWGHGDWYSAHGCYFWTRINRIERIVPCGRHFHPSASNCCYCNRKSVKICAICGSINLKRYFLKIIILTDEIVPTDELSSHRWIRLPQITRMNTDYYWTRISRISRIVPCGRHFHPSASNCCYCNRKSENLCNLWEYKSKDIFHKEYHSHGWNRPHGWIKLPQITDYFPCGGTRIISNTNKSNRTNSPSGAHFV